MTQNEKQMKVTQNNVKVCKYLTFSLLNVLYKDCNCV